MSSERIDKTKHTSKFRLKPTNKSIFDFIQTQNKSHHHKLLNFQNL
jgi:hypothetical protein